MRQSGFLTGRSGSWNGCGFDRVLNPANLVKILEGNYTDKPKQKDFARFDENIDVGRTF